MHDMKVGKNWGSLEHWGDRSSHSDPAIAMALSPAVETSGKGCRPCSPAVETSLRPV
jgi:hypothetical protein